ncbi:hypothetical protein [Haloarchaeobius litoreus]|uniref:Uncharacterized protein n=1 Tax=Haloarchaeobius litoreus TaxID=755306 RepID=A0ABD6DPD9_9EURY|nr:hypothetical protein [Haloarchaeobius litoreus]
MSEFATAVNDGWEADPEYERATREEALSDEFLAVLDGDAATADDGDDGD